MPDKEHDWEFGIREEGHVGDSTEGSVVLGENGFNYELSGENWGELPEGWVYKEATAVDVDSKDRVCVFNRGTCPVIVFDTDGKIIDTWGEGVFKNPHGITVGPDDELFCVDNGDSTVRKFSSEGKLLMTIGEPGAGAPKMSGIPFAKPTHVAVNKSNGEFYVADGYSNASVHKYSPDGKLLLTWGESGTGPGQFNIVHNIVIGSNGYLYVADRENHRIQIFDKEGVYIDQITNMHRPCALNIHNDKLYVGELGYGMSVNQNVPNIGPRISIYNLNKELLYRWGEGFGNNPNQLYAPHSIAVDQHGNIYLGEVSKTNKQNIGLDAIKYKGFRQLRYLN